jgi:alkanesulfonate monooxygenase SsuD/methylene tetrahydromethanopterin reductase-like flavin-dependent oxidoreductase (luciferase family)
MHGFVVGADADELRARREALAELGHADTSGWLAGTPGDIVARLEEYADAGVERVMLQHLAHRDAAALELIAAEVVPALA